MSSGLVAAEVFTSLHIAATAAISGGLTLVAALFLLERRGPGLTECLLVGVLTAAAVFLWRKSANMPQLNTDGLRGFSANDWLSPVVTFVWLGLYGKLKPPQNEVRFGRAQAAAALVALAVNVVTI